MPNSDQTISSLSSRRRVFARQEIAATPGKVWLVLSDFQRLDDWLSGAVMQEGRGREVGAMRKFAIGEASFVEKIVALDDPNRSLTYCLVEGPLPVRNYEVAQTVKDNGRGGALVEWHAAYNPHNIEPEKCDRILTNAYAQALKTLKLKCEGGEHE